jgi:hypothetical protein
MRLTSFMAYPLLSKIRAQIVGLAGKGRCK